MLVDSGGGEPAVVGGGASDGSSSWGRVAAVVIVRGCGGRRGRRCVVGDLQSISIYSTLE